MDPGLDHLVYAVPDLVAGVADFAARTGVRPVPGGSHAGRGTANFLVGLGGGAYVEIIGPDPAQPAHEGERPFGISPAAVPRLATWAVRPADLDATVARARARGIDPGEVEAMSRRTPDGELLAWRLTVGAAPLAEGLVPFLIDWGTTPHPTTRALPTTALVSLRATHPDPPAVRELLAAVGADLEVEPGERAALHAVVGAEQRVHLAG